MPFPGISLWSKFSLTLELKERILSSSLKKEYCRSFTDTNIALEKDLKATFEIGYKTNTKSISLQQISRGIEKINTPVS